MPNRNNEKKVIKYSIRKYKNGAASVAVGALLFSGMLGGGSVEAATEEDGSNVSPATEAVLPAADDAPVVDETETTDAPEVEESQKVIQEEAVVQEDQEDVASEPVEAAEAAEAQEAATLADVEVQAVDAQTLAEQYTPEAAEIVVNLNEAGMPVMPSATEGIANFDALPEGTTVEFKTASIAGRTATITITYSDDSTDEVTAPVSLNRAETEVPDDSQPDGEDVPVVDENPTETPDENPGEEVDEEENEQPSALNPMSEILREAYANLNSVDMSIDPETQTLRAVVTYADGSQDATELDLNAPLPSAKQFAQKFVQLSPLEKLAISQLESIDLSLDAGSKVVDVAVVYPGGSRDEVSVPIAVGGENDEESSTANPIAQILKKAYANLKRVDVSVDPAAQTLRALVTYADGSKDATELDLNAPLPSAKQFAQKFITLTPMEKFAISQLESIDVSLDPAGQVVKLVVTYPGGLQNVITVPFEIGKPAVETDADKYEPKVVDELVIDLNKDAAKLPAAKEVLTNYDELPEGTKVAYGNADKIDLTGETAAQFVEVIVTYPDGTTDTVSAPLTVIKKAVAEKTDADKYEPKAIDEIVVDLNEDKLAIPTAEQAIKNFDKLPKGTKAAYTNLAHLDLSGETKAQFVEILVTYPDKSTDTVSVPLRVIPADAEKPEEDKELEKLEKQIQKLQEAIKELEKQNNKQDKELNKLQKELNKLEKQLKGSKHDQKHLEKDIDKLEDRIKELEKQLRDKHDHDKDHDHGHDKDHDHGHDKDHDHGHDKDHDHGHDKDHDHGHDKDHDHRHDKDHDHGKDKDRDDVKPDEQRPGKHENDDKRDDVKPDNKAPQAEDVDKSGALPETGSVAAVAGLGAAAILTGLGLASTNKKKNDEE